MKSYRIFVDGFHVDTILRPPARNDLDLRQYAYAWAMDNGCPAGGVRAA